jgi:hypothetical protein
MPGLWLVGVLDSTLLVLRGLGALHTLANGHERVRNGWLEGVLSIHNRLNDPIGFRTKKAPGFHWRPFAFAP